MGSLRTRLTAGFAAALVTTMVVFALALLFARKSMALSELQGRVEQELEHTVGIAQQVLQLGATIFVTERFSPVDSAGISRGAVGDSAAVATDKRLRQFLELAPDYILVVNRGGKVVYRSRKVRELTGVDSARFESVALGMQSGSQRLMRVTVKLDRNVDNNGVPAADDDKTVNVTDQILIAMRQVGGEKVDRVWVGMSAAYTEFAPSELVAMMLIVSPFLLALSLGVAYVIAGRAFHPVDEIIDQVEAISDGRSLHRRLAIGAAGDELARLSSTLNAMIERLESSFGALRRFTADASHELKTPLTVIRADVERSMSPRSTGHEKEVAMEEALQQVTRMADLVDSLLTLARADEGRFDLHREPVQLLDLTREVIETARLLGETAGLTIDVPILEAAEIQGDPTRLRQLFLNLVTNAIKYTARGGRVEITLARSDDEVVFAVRDTGIGIAAADLPHIFERFWRADRARSRASERGGFGLGLAISHWIAHAHGGSLTVESRLGRGSRFVAHLPLPQAN